jgi:predicted MFS family arabinose efflux permease
MPRNWPPHRKITIALLVSLCQLVTLMTASVMAAALPIIAHDLNVSDSVTRITFSVYFLGLAIGPLPIASFSEAYGRRPVWIACNSSYCLCNALRPVGNSIGLMTAGRFLAGTGASAGIAVSFSD